MHAMPRSSKVVGTTEVVRGRAKCDNVKKASSAVPFNKY